MAKKDYFLLVDTETTQPFREKLDNKGNVLSEKIEAQVADFGAIVVDRKGNEYARCAVLVAGVYGELPLFYTSDPQDQVFGKHTLDRRYTKYANMLETGSRMLASVNAINRWLDNVRGKYDPILTAYNLSFDEGKCLNTDIDLSIYDKKFCLWYASQAKWGQTKAYRQFVLDLHEFRPRTDLGNMSYRTNAETMARFILNNPELEDEPHTALEDAIYYELPILKRLVQTTKKKVWMNPKPYNWRDYQIKDWYKPV